MMSSKPSHSEKTQKPDTLRTMNRLPQSEIESLRKQSKSDAEKVKNLLKMRGPKTPA